MNRQQEKEFYKIIEIKTMEREADGLQLSDTDVGEILEECRGKGIEPTDRDLAEAGLGENLFADDCKCCEGTGHRISSMFINMGALGESECDVALSLSGEFGDPAMTLGFTAGSFTTTKAIPVNYCPICGRRLL